MKSWEKGPISIAIDLRKRLYHASTPALTGVRRLWLPTVTGAYMQEVSVFTAQRSGRHWMRMKSWEKGPISIAIDLRKRLYHASTLVYVVFMQEVSDVCAYA